MANSTAALQAQLDALDLAIGTGARVVSFQDRRVEYNDTKSMIAARTYLYNLLNPNASRTVQVYTTKGV